MAHFSLMWLLQKELVRAISLALGIRNKDPTARVRIVNMFELEGAEAYRLLSLKKISLKKINHTSQILYFSAVSLKLAKVYGQPAIEIAKTLANYLAASMTANVSQTSQQNSVVLGGVWKYFKVQTSPPGWLQLSLSDKGIGEWLQLLNQGPTEAIEAETELGAGQNSICQSLDVPGSGSLFPIQHAYARCCSLLRLAHQENLIALQNPKPADSPSHWRIIQPDPLPWLDRAGKLCLTHPVERQLIHQLVESVDGWGHCQPRLNRQPLMAQADNLSKAFQAFHCRCPLWGEARNLTPTLIQARLGLIRVTQMVLQTLLKSGLGATAPIRL